MGIGCAAFIIWAICGIGAAMIAESKGHSGVGWFFAGLLLGPIALLIIGFMAPVQKPGAIENQRQAQPQIPEPDLKVKCPFCAEKIMPDAKVCRYCNRDLPQPEPPPPAPLEDQLQVAHRLLRKGDADAALKAYQAIARENPDHRDAWRCIATMANAEESIKEEARNQVKRLTSST